ncbi:hypothetical protein ACFL6S_01310 [Candidatus Poribacteria bacterium]
MRFMKSNLLPGLLIILLLVFLIPHALAGWKVIYTTRDTLKSGASLGYKPFKLYKNVEYGIVVKKIAGNVDADVFLFNPGDRLVAKGVKKGDSNLLLFKPSITEEGYKIVIKSKKSEGEIRLTLAHK